MDRQNFDPSNVTAWSQVQHDVSEETQAGQEGFEQHLGTRVRALPLPLSGLIAITIRICLKRPGPYR